MAEINCASDGVELDTLLNAKDVASILKVSPSFAYQLMRSGQIKTVRIGRAVRVIREHLYQYIRANIADPREELDSKLERCKC